MKENAGQVGYRGSFFVAAAPGYGGASTEGTALLDYQQSDRTKPLGVPEPVNLNEAPLSSNY